MLPSIFAAGVSTISDRRSIRFGCPRMVYCTKRPLRLPDLSRWNLRTCLMLLSVVEARLEYVQLLTFIAGFQLKVCRAQTERSTLIYISNGIGGSDGLNVLAFETSYVHVKCS